ncbi:hypothetical protein K469DRAFT_684110 [Zopfia rhizophila CBS 207.26]|uniref:F-box domain-containing protein n=1 Tax=Zopfia rhizophila CBS 207.26 TaxID=1314779 RepID=A0A6A6EAB9_9PEZI|nr:hypothetical protein K469DRAFT_684110 [Zopfia rhizophila CBS 207.26]
MFPLLTLPTDIILPIVESVDDQSDLVSLAQTCTKLQPLAEAQLFKTIYVRHGKHARDLSAVLQARPVRFNYVQKLEATPTVRGWECIEVMPSLVRKMGNLRELRVESPHINSSRYDRCWTEVSEAEYIDMFKEANESEGEVKPLKNLRSFTLHSHGADKRYSEIHTALPIFLSLTVTYVHISCIDIDDFTLPSSAPRAKSPLKTLVLDECRIMPAGLSTLLSLPRNLSSLALREVAHHYPRNSELNKHLIAVLFALSHQKHSLQFLQHTCLPMNNAERYFQLPGDSTGLSQFKELKTLELSQHSILRKILAVRHLAPPSLDTYRLTGLEYDYDGHWENMPTKISAIASGTSFRHLELHTKPVSVGFDGLPSCFMLASRAQKVIEIARMMKEKEITTTLVGYQRFQYIPPYLYGEKEPLRRVCFDSEEFWTEEDRYLKEQAEEKKADEIKDKVVPMSDEGTVIAAKISAGYRTGW